MEGLEVRALLSADGLLPTLDSTDPGAATTPTWSDAGAMVAPPPSHDPSSTVSSGENVPLLLASWADHEGFWMWSPVEVPASRDEPRQPHDTLVEDLGESNRDDRERPGFDALAGFLTSSAESGLSEFTKAEIGSALALSTRWVVTEFLRHSVPPEGIAFPGDVYFEPEIGQAGVPRPILNLPNDSPMTMIGSIRAGEGPDRYAIRPGPEGFRVEFTAFDPTSDLADFLIIFEGNGTLVVSGTVSTAENTIVLDIRAAEEIADQEVILRIGPDGPKRGSGEEMYALTVIPNASPTGSDRFPTSSGSPLSDPNAPTTAVSPPDPGRASPGLGQESLPVPVDPIWTDGQAIEFSSTAPDRRADVEDAEAVLGPDALGPLPSLAAAPFGGIFALGEAATRVGRHEAAAIDLDLIDAGRFGFGTEAVGPREWGADIDPVPAAALATRASGELPTVAATHPRVSVEAIPQELLGAVAAVTVDLAMESAVVPREVSVREAIADVTAEESAIEPPASRRVLRWTVAGLTALMAAHLLLPDLGLLVPLSRSRRRGRRWLGGLGGSWCRPPRSIG